MDTEIGMKIGDAMFSCSDSPTEMRKGKGKGEKGKGKEKVNLVHQLRTLLTWLLRNCQRNFVCS